MKKFISILLSVLLIIGSVAISISADNSEITFIPYDNMSGNMNAGTGTAKTETDNMTITVNGGILTKYANYISGYNFAQWQSSSNNRNLIFELKNVPAGNYVLAFSTADNNQARGSFDVVANNVSLGEMNCLDTKLSGKKLVEHSFDTAFAADGNVTLTITPTATATSKQIFLYNIVLTKVGEGGEVIDPEESTVPTESTTTTTTTVAQETFFVPSDVANMDNWIQGWWDSSNGKYNTTYQNNSRACVKNKVEVQEGTTYKFTISGTDASGLNIVLRSYDSTGAFKTTTILSSDLKYTVPSGIKYVSVTMYDKSDLINYITNGTVTASMVVDGTEEEPSSSTTTTTTTTTTQAPSSSDTPSVDTDEYVNRPTDYFTSTINASVGVSTKTSDDGAVSFTAEYGRAVFQSKYVNSLNCLQWQPNDTGILSFTFNNVAPAVYKITINSGDHLAQNRSYFDIAVNDTYYETLGFEAGGKSYVSHELANTLTLSNKGTVTVELTNNLEMNTQNGRTTKQTVIESVVLTKIDDVLRDPLYVETNMKKGASIRLNNKNGIRFYTQVDTQAIDSLIESGATVELGTLIAPSDLVDGNDLTFDSDRFIDVKYDLDAGYYEGNDTFVGSITSIKESNTSYSTENGNTDRPFIGRGYVKVTKDGKTYINYAKYYEYNVTNNTRSLAYISLVLQGDEDAYSVLSDEHKALVDAWAAKHGSVTYEYFNYSTTNYNGNTMSDTGVIMLPKNYSEEGKPVRLVIDCHGYSATINSSENFYNKYNWCKTLVHDGYAVLAAVENAYHMGTPFAIESYINAYKYVIENYNVYEEVYVNGNSMGGITSINLVCSGEIPVIAHSLQYPVTSIVHQLYYNEWATDTRKSLSNFYNFAFPNDENGTAYTPSTFPFTSAIRTFGTDAELDLLEDNFFDKIVPKYSYYRFTNILNDSKIGFASGFEDFISCNTQERVDELYKKMTIDYPVPVLVQQCLDDGSVRTHMTKHFVNSVENGSNNITAIYYNGSKHGGDIGNDVTYLAKDNTTLSVRESSVKMSKFITDIENTITDKK